MPLLNPMNRVKPHTTKSPTVLHLGLKSHLPSKATTKVVSELRTVPQIIWIAARKPCLSRLKQMQQYCICLVYLPDIYLQMTSIIASAPGSVFLRRFRLFLGQCIPTFFGTVWIFFPGQHEASQLRWDDLVQNCSHFAIFFLWYPNDGLVSPG